MGSNADFMENNLKPEEYAYPSDSSKIKSRLETFITPTKSHENKTPRVFFHPASIGDGPQAPLDPSKPPTIRILIKCWPLGPQVLLNLFRQPLGSPGIPWEPLGSPGIPWEPLGSHGNPLGNPGIRCDPLGSLGFDWF